MTATSTPGQQPQNTKPPNPPSTFWARLGAWVLPSTIVFTCVRVRARVRVQSGGFANPVLSPNGTNVPSLFPCGLVGLDACNLSIPSCCPEERWPEMNFKPHMTCKTKELLQSANIPTPANGTTQTLCSCQGSGAPFIPLGREVDGQVEEIESALEAFRSTELD